MRPFVGSYRHTRALLREYVAAGGPPEALLVLLALTDHADGDGVSCPGVALLAQQLGRSARQVRAHLTKLERAGWAEPVGSRKGGRRWMTTRWRLVHPSDRKPTSALGRVETGSGRPPSDGSRPEAGRSETGSRGGSRPEADFRRGGSKREKQEGGARADAPASASASATPPPVETGDPKVKTDRRQRPVGGVATWANQAVAGLLKQAEAAVPVHDAVPAANQYDQLDKLGERWGMPRQPHEPYAPYRDRLLAEQQRRRGS